MKSKVYWVKASRREAPAALSEKAEALYLKLGLNAEPVLEMIGEG